MTLIVISALLLSILIYLTIGLLHRRNVRMLGDLIPVIKGKLAHVRGHSEFSASTVATSISLATVILAFFELVPIMGLWLFWAVITTSLGFLLFALLAKRIWFRLSTYQHRPSMHEYIGNEYGSKSVGLVASICTTIGYLCAFAVELTVGSTFLASLIPEIPLWVTVIIIAGIGFLYTSLGGFRTVVVSDRYQMWFIWLLLGALTLFYIIYSFNNGGFQFVSKSLPENLKSITFSSALIPFILGLLVMNLFTYISNMALWQRIAGSPSSKIVTKGLYKTTFHSALSWGLFVVVAAGGLLLVKPVPGENLLSSLLHFLLNVPGGKLIIFIVVLGLYAAMLSTASTQLIAVAHTIYEDIFSVFRKKTLSERLVDKKEVTISRVILISAAIIAIIIVELLRVFGFSIADLAFSIYGAALSLAPPILFSLFLPRTRLKLLSKAVKIAVILGFASAWFCAIYGKSTSNGNLIFLSPVAGFFASLIILTITLFIIGYTKDHNTEALV